MWLQLKKHDMATGETLLWHDADYIAVGEPVFVAADDARSEDDGTSLYGLEL